MASWDGVIRRYRRLNGMTQASFGELVGVEQATVSRWERGFHEPELVMQKRLRSLLSREFLASDAMIMHRIRNCLNPMKMARHDGRNLVVSLRAASLHGVTREALEGFEYQNLFTELLDAQWEVARRSGFFKGEIASMHVFNDWVPACGGPARYCEALWTPVFLDGGEIMLASEFADIDPSVFQAVPEGSRVDIVGLDDLLQ